MNVVVGPPPGHAPRRRWTRIVLPVMYAFATLVAVDSLIGVCQFWDVGSDSWLDRLRGEGAEFQRGAAVVGIDRFGDRLTAIRYLDQNWRAADSLWFYTTTQGSDLLPYDFFLTLEKPGSSELVRSNENMNAYRYLPQKPTISNPDGLPVGLVKDTYQGKAYVGLTCAACHTGQVNYAGVGYRVDGA